MGSDRSRRTSKQTNLNPKRKLRLIRVRVDHDIAELLTKPPKIGRTYPYVQSRS